MGKDGRYLIGIDIGTSGTKVILVDREGTVAVSASAEYPLSTPRPLWAEQNPEDWWAACCAVVRQLLRDAGISGDDVACVGLSGQMHGTVFLDTNNAVIRPAILWCDQRTAEECAWIADTIGAERVLELTCNPVLTGFSAGKIIWLRRNEPAHYARVQRVLLPKDYIRLRLTGEFATEVSDASGTSLLDVRARKWSNEMLDGLEIPREWMPSVHESNEITGRVNASAANETGLLKGTPVVGGGGDQAAGAVGNGVIAPGIVSSTVGTSGVVFGVLEEPRVDPQMRVHTFCHAVPDTWHVMGVMLSAGGSLRWYRDTFCELEKQRAAEQGMDPYELMLQSVAGVPPGSEGLVFLPYLTGERTPYPDPNARGVFFGATLRHTKPAFTRAVLEGVAYGLRDSFEILAGMGVTMTQVRASGGGARSSLWRQIQADVTGREHVTISVDEGPAFGAALLAGVGIGAWEDVRSACEATISVTSRCAASSATSVYERYYSVYRDLYTDLKRHFEAVTAIGAQTVPRSL